MIRTIRQRIYLMSVLPLAVLAVALVSFNGLYRIEEANRELREAQQVAAEFLNGAAAEALVLGNTLTFEQTVAAAMKTSPALLCITLADSQGRVVSTAGECSRAGEERARNFPVRAPADGLSDFEESRHTDVAVGQLRISMSDANVLAKRRQVVVQLTLSLSLIAVVLTLVGKLMRARLIEPIQRIDAAMRALGQRDYDAGVHVSGNDELASLAEEVNQTIRIIAAYTRDLERHRIDAERALHDADEANMSRESLVRSLTEELEEPLSRMHSELTAIAMKNHDPGLRQPIKNALALLQEAEANFSDLIEVASNAQTGRRSGMRDFAEVITDMESDVRRLSESERVLVNLAVTQMSALRNQSHEQTGLFVDLDEAHLRKALVYLIRAMARRCEEPGVHVSVEVIRRSSEELHISVHLKAFYARLPEGAALSWLDGLSHYANAPPRILAWTEREARIIAYLLRTVGITPTFGTTPDGTVNVFLDTTCRFTIEHAESNSPMDWILASSPVEATIVSDDPTLSRVTARGDLSNDEVAIVSFSEALADSTTLRSRLMLLVDVADIVAALSLLNELKRVEGLQPHLVAICPPGHVNEALGNRLFDLGFRGIVQKPLTYARVTQVVRTLLTSAFRSGNPQSFGRR